MLRCLVLGAFVASALGFSAPQPLGLSAKGLGLKASASGRASHVAKWMMADRRPFIAGNWKMNPETLDEAKSLAAAIAKGASTASAQVAIMVPHTYLYACGSEFKGSNVEMGAQSVYFETKGAFTGAVSTGMVKTVGAEHCLCGHSERRVIFKNDDTAINKKVRAVLDDGLSPMLCIGESKDEYEGNLNTAVCALQLSKDLKDVSKEEMKRVTIAYEPVWAIGTGLTCDPETAQDVHAFIRSWLEKMYDKECADGVRILYGGSVTPETVDALMAKPDIDGALVGGASLDAAKFERIMNFK